MIVETSALMAVFFQEAGWEALAQRIKHGPSRIAAVSWLEANIVAVRRYGEEARKDLEFTRSELGIEIVPFGPEHAEAAIEAFLRYGKGRHRAALNFGDCASYALAKATGEPLLFVGGDFAQTDVTPAKPP